MSEFVRRVKQSQKPIVSRLSQLDIELTERCNNDCIHCYINRPANDPSARKREMTTVQVKDVLKQAADLGCLQVRFTGGEPLLRSDFEEVYVFARQLGLKVWLFTSGRPITPHLADLFVRIPLLRVIEITVYGMRRESYEAVTRAPGSFAQFQRALNLLRERNIPFVVKWVHLPPNKHETNEFEAWAKTIPWMTRPPVCTMFLDLRNRRDDAEKDASIKGLRVSPQEGLAMMTRDAAKYRRDVEGFASKFMGPHGDRLFHCGAGKCICVDAYGRVQPCMSIRAPEWTVNLISGTSTVRDGSASLADALTQFSQLRDLRANNPEYLHRCARCFLKGLCEQCPAKSLVEHGTLDTPVEYVCEVAHAQARYLGWLGENEHGWEVKVWKARLNKEGVSKLEMAPKCDIAAQ
jgi:radical SAM protein with 4Fe4S-binding SPASM domain